MFNTTVQIPSNLYPAGLIDPKDATLGDLPVCHDQKTNSLSSFIAQELQQGELINEAVDALDLLRLYRTATGDNIVSLGQMIFALLKNGYRYKKNGFSAFVNVTQESFEAARDKHVVQIISTLPAAFLQFPGRKTFNQMSMVHRSGFIRDFLKHYGFPQPYQPTYLINKSKKLFIRFTLDRTNSFIEADALPFEDAAKINTFSDTSLITQ